MTVDCPWGPGVNPPPRVPVFVGRRPPRGPKPVRTDVPTPWIYERTAAPDPATGALPGIEYVHGDRVGFIPQPTDGIAGKCWWCRVERIGPWPPLCVACSKDCFGEAVMSGEALARRGIIRGARAR